MSSENIVILINIAYLVSAVCFIIGLKLLGSPATARRGNQIAAVLCRFLMLDPRGPKHKGLVIETFVTTRLLGAIGEKANSVVIDDLPVGMKYVADVLNELESKGRYRNIELKPTDLAFAAEESHGVATRKEWEDMEPASR